MYIEFAFKTKPTYNAPSLKYSNCATGDSGLAFTHKSNLDSVSKRFFLFIIRPFFAEKVENNQQPP
jgi:hypothetical protein